MLEQGVAGMGGLVGSFRVYSEGAGEPLKGLEQKSDRLRILFWEDH